MLNEQQLITASNETYLPNTSGLITAQRVRDFNNTDLIPTIFDISASLQNTINSITVGSGFVTTQSFNSYTSSQTAESASFNVRVNELETSETALNLYTQSINTYTQSMNQFTSSYTTGSFTGSFSGDGSKLYGITASGAGVGILDEGIFQGTAVTLNFTGSNISASVVAGIGIINVTPTDVSMFLSKSTFEAYTASLDTTFATDAQLSASASTLQDNINSLSQSVAVTDLAQSSSIAQLLGFSSSLDATYATDAQLSASVAALSASVTVTTNGLSSSIGVLDSEVNALQSWSSSLDTIYATDTQLSASASTLQNNINTLSSSVAVTDLAQSASIAALQQFSSSLDSTYATDTQLSASASTLQGNINSLSSSVAVTTLGLSSSVAALQSFSSSLDSTYATDTQLSASASTLQNDINSRLTTASFNSYTASASTNTSASVSELSQSVAVTTLTINGKLGTGSFENYTSSNDAKVNSLINKTGSYATTGSNTFNGNQIISGNLNVSGNITATSGTFQYVETIFETASVIYSSGSNQFGDASNDTQTLFGRVDVKTGPLVITGSTFVSGNITLAQGSDLVTHHIRAAAVNGVEIQNNSGNTAILVGAGGSLGTTFYGQINTTAISSSGNITGNLLGTASYANKALTASFAENVNPTDVSMFVSQSVFNAYTSSEASNVSASINSATSSLSASLTLTDNSKLNTSSFNSYTSSNDSKVNSLIAATGSYITSAQTASMSVLSSSYAVTASYALNASAVDTGSLVTTASFNSYTASEATNVSGAINTATGSSVITASISGDTITFTKGNGSTFPIVVPTGSGGSIDTGSFATTGSNNFIGNQTITGSLTLSSSADVELNIIGNTNLTGSLLVTGGFNAKVAFPALNVTNNILQSTGSIIVAQDIVRSGGGANDVASLRLQARTGSAGAGDALTSTISAQNNLNTTTFLSASAVASLQATFSTGSGGGTVGYNAGLTATAQSGSAISVLSGNTIRLGTNAANVITSTGSFGPMVLVAPLNSPAFRIASGSFEVTTPQGSGSFYTNLPITSSGARINGDGRFSGIEVIALGGANGSGSISVQNDVTASNISASQNIYANTVFANQFNGTASLATNAVSASYAQSASQAINSVSASYSVTASFALNAGGVVDTGSFATTGSNLFKGEQTIESGSLSGSLIDNLGDIYTGSNNAQHIVTLGSASMAFLISSSTTNPNTLYFVI